jgi:hypothetical protein
MKPRTASTPSCWMADSKNASHTGCSITPPIVGSWNWNTAPFGALGKARSCLPCDSMMVRLTASSIPMPSCLFYKSTDSIAVPSWTRNCSIASFVGGGRSPKTHRFFPAFPLLHRYGRFSRSRCHLFFQWASYLQTAAAISPRKVLDVSSRIESSVPSRSCPPRTPLGAWRAASRWHWH